MAIYRGDGVRLLENAVWEKNLERKVELLIDTMNLHFRELEYVLSALGVENFSELGLKEIREGTECTE